MIGKLLKATADKPCSCPDGKKCEGCKRKRILKPQVYIEEPRRLPIPITIGHYKDTKDKPRWSIRKKESAKRSTLSQWYRRRRTLNDLKKDYQKLKKKEKLEREAHERETVLLEYLKLQETTKPESETKTTTTAVKEQKPKRVRGRTTTAKPTANSKFVSVNQYQRYSLSDRFMNCCYKVCCQFYCYLSCIFIVGFIIFSFI